MKPSLTLVVVVLLAATGCGRKPAAGPPSLAYGSDLCAACGMAVSAPGFSAAARTPAGDLLAYDAIECLVGDLRTRRGAAAPKEIWLPDLPTGTLHPAARMTVVLADFPSPMGGGFAAFSDSARAAAEAARRRGVAGELGRFVSGDLRRPAR